MQPIDLNAVARSDFQRMPDDGLKKLLDELSAYAALATSCAVEAMPHISRIEAEISRREAVRQAESDRRELDARDRKNQKGASWNLAITIIAALASVVAAVAAVIAVLK